MSERIHQEALFLWARLPSSARLYPGIDLMSSSLNGVKLTPAAAARAKAGGMLKGQWDIQIPVARKGYSGLIIELKFGKNGLTARQIWYRDRMQAEGWLTEVCRDWVSAKGVIESYLWADSRASPGSGWERHNAAAATLGAGYIEPSAHAAREAAQVRAINADFSAAAAAFAAAAKAGFLTST